MIDEQVKVKIEARTNAVAFAVRVAELNRDQGFSGFTLEKVMEHANTIATFILSGDPPRRVD